MFRSIGSTFSLVLMLVGWVSIAFSALLIYSINTNPDPVPWIAHMIAAAFFWVGLVLSAIQTKERVLIPLLQKVENSDTAQNRIDGVSSRLAGNFPLVDMIFIGLYLAGLFLLFVGFANDDISHLPGILLMLCYLSILLVGLLSALARATFCIFTTFFVLGNIITEPSIFLDLPKYLVSLYIQPAVDSFFTSLSYLFGIFLVFGLMFHNIATWFSDSYYTTRDRVWNPEWQEYESRAERVTVRDKETYEGVWKYLLGIVVFLYVSYLLVEFFFWFLAGLVFILLDLFIRKRVKFSSLIVGLPDRGYAAVGLAAVGTLVVTYLMTVPFYQVAPKNTAETPSPIVERATEAESDDSVSLTSQAEDIKTPDTIEPKTLEPVVQNDMAPAAGEIPIRNASFESDKLGAAGWQFGISHWDGTRHGLMLPIPPVFVDEANHDGKQAAFLSKAGSWMSQILDAQPKAGWEYRLTVLAALRLEPNFNEGSFKLAIYSNNQELTSETFQVSERGAFTERQISVVFEGEPQPSDRIRIRIDNIDARQISFDHVRFYAAPVEN